MEKGGFVYIVASGRNGTLYTGVTSDLIQRVAQHKDGTFGGFTAKYGCKLLVWYEQHGEIEPAIRREKQIKEWKRLWKLRLIEEMNPDWDDLFEVLKRGHVTPAKAGAQSPQGNSTLRGVICLGLGPGLRRDDGI